MYNEEYYHTLQRNICSIREKLAENAKNALVQTSC